MRKQKSNILKVIISIILILLLTLLMYAKMTNQTVIALSQSAVDVTAASLQRAIDNARDWTDKKDKDGKVTLKNPSAPTLSELVDPSQVRDGGIYITHEDLLNIPSLFCSAKGVALPGMGSTVVRSGGREATTTDQGKETAYLTANDIPSSTVFRNLNEWTEYGADYTTKYEDTVSKTIAKFTLAEIRKCTPAEAWVLAEFNNNVPGQPATIVTNTEEGTTNDDVNLEIIDYTDEEYIGEPPRQLATGNNSYASTFIDSVRNITKYVKSNDYEYGQLDIIPGETDESNKNINNTGLIKWALYSCGFEKTPLSIEDECKHYNFEKNEDVTKVQAGDIVFLDEDGEEGIVVYASYNKVYDLSSDDKIRLEGDYEEFSFQPIGMTIDEDNFKYSYRVSNISGTRETVATPQDSSVVEIDGVTLYIVGEPGEERYVRKEGDKYYYVEINNDYAPYTYVQHAWWKEKTVGQNSGGGIKDTDLANEAEDFENYIKEVTGESDVSNLERNSDGTFKIDYKVSMEPQDTGEVTTRFNNVTNKYIVGPFKVEYLRSVTKQGSRPKISFSGISDSILVGADADKNELLDDDGKSILQLGKNYRFVYSNTNDPSTNFGHDNARNEFDTDEDYPFPSSGEEFYIEIDYIEDLAFIKNFKFDFQYLTAGGEYEYYKGNFLKINWTQFADVRSKTVSTGLTANINNSTVAISSRLGGTTGGSDTSGGGKGGNFPVVETRGFDIADPEESDGFGGTWRMDVIRDSCWGDGDYIYVKGHVARNWFSTTSGQNITLSEVTCSTAESISKDGVYFTVKFKRDYTKARVNESHTIKVKASISAGTSGWASSEECNVSADLFYENALLKDTAKVKSSSSKVTVRGNKLFVRGFIDKTNQTVDFDVDMIHKETPQSAVYSWWVDEGDCLSVVDEKNGVFKIEKPGTCNIGCATGDGMGTSVEVKTYKVVVPTFCFDTSESRSKSTSVNTSLTFYNAMGDLENEIQFGNNTLAYPVVDAITDGQIEFREAGNFTEYMDSDYKYTDITFIYIDDEGSITAKVSWEPKKSDGSQVTPGSGSGGNGSGENGSGENGNGGNGSGENGSGGNGSGGNGSGGNGSGGNGSGGNGSGGNGSGGNGSGENGSGGNGSGGNGSGENGSGGNGSGGNGSGGNGSGGNGSGGNGSGGIGSGVNTEYSYCYYLRATSATIEVGQDQINAVGSHEVIDVDANNGLAVTPSGVPVELEMLTIEVDLRTSLSGMVWIDNDEQKDKSEYGNLGIYDEGTKDKPAKKNSVEIIVWKVKYEVATGKEVEREKALGWDDSEKEIDFDKTRIYVDENGQYKIPKMQVPAEEGLDGTKYVMSYDVEFIYDGQTYEATEYLVPSSGEDKTSVKDKLDAFKKTADETKGPEKDYADYANSSYIVENAEERKKFDSYFTEVYGKDVMDNDGNTEGLATGGINDGKYYHDYDVDPTRGIKETDLEYTSEKVGEGDYEKRKSNLVTNDEEGYVLDQYRFAARTSEAGLLLPYERLYHVEEKFYDNYEFQANQYKPIDEYFHQINLGLLERYHSDLGVKKDLYTANVVVNGNSNLTTYNSLMPLTEEALNLQVKPEYRQHTYKIDLYNSDYMYRSGAYSSIQDEITKTIIEAIKEGTELRLFVTYKLEFINESVFTDVSINEFVDYYDKTFTRVDEDVKAQIEDQTADDDEPSRVEKIVAYAPYYRKLTTVAGASAYNYNKAEDLNESLDESGNVRNTVVNSAGELILDKAGDKFATGSVEFEDIEETNAERKNSNYKRSVSKSLNGLNGSGPNEDLTLEPGEVLEVFVTYEVDEDGYKKVQQETEANADTRKDTLLGKKNNIVEISKYSTFYTEESCQRHKTTSYLPKQVSGRVDQDSAPNNIRMKDRGDSIDTKMLEDDTEFAPCVTVEVREGEPRTLDGVVWEDLRSDNTVGNGKYDEGTESGIKGIDVTMVEKIRVTKEDLDRIRKYAQENNSSVAESLNDLNTLCHEFEYIWKTDDFPGFENEIKSGDDGKYTFKNFVTGSYVVRFEYGNDADENVDMKYNGQDYKNTAYQVAKDGSIRLNPTKVAMAGENQDVPIDTTDILHLPGKATLNNEWHDLSANENAKALEEDRVSDARDYEPQRLRTIAYSRTIANENAEVLAAAFNETKDVTGEDTKDHISEDYKKILENNKQKLVENTRMVANTAKLFVDIEKQDTIAYKKVVTPDGEDIIKTTEAKDGKHEYYIKNIDFGLVERPETRMNIRKEISKIELYKEDGGEVILSVRCDENGNIIKEGADNIRVDKISEIHKESLGDGQGFKYIAMESSLLNGLQVRLTYTIDIINNSEEDYVSATLANYKGMNEIYKLANHFENVSEERLYSEENLQGTVPFNAGKAIIYGRFLGTYYYTNKDIADSEDINKTYAAIDEDGKTINKYDDEVIVKTTIDQVVDYIDNDLSISLDDINYENMSWVASSDADIQHKLSEIAFRKGEDGKYVKDITKLQDDKERAYISKSNDKTTKNNIYLSTNNTMVEKPTKIEYKVAEIDDKKQPVMEIDNNKLQPSIITEEFDAYTSKENVNSIDNSNTAITTQLVPDSYKAKTNAGNVTSTATISIVTTAQANEESVNNMNYDNLIEVAMYSNSVGRRDMQTIPGNANMIAKDNKAYLAGYIKAYDSNSQSYVFKTQTVNGVNTERDAYAARDTVTFSEPTGLSLARQQANKTIRILLASLIIAAIAVVAAIIVTAIRKNKYDDGDILKNKS